MKRIAAFALFSALVLLVIFSGCTGTTPAPQPTAVPTQVITQATPAPAQDPYPNAVAINTFLPFGSGAKTGEIAVTGYKVKPTINYNDPSWSSQKEMSASSAPLETQKGYSTKQPSVGNTFVFVYLKATATSTESAWAPSPANIVLYSDGKTYQYTALSSAQVVVEGETEDKYDYLVGTGKSVIAIIPGKSNAIKGYLVYEVPATFAPEKADVLITLYGDQQGAWKLG